MDLNIGQNKWEEIMSVKDTIKKSVLESGTFAQYDMLKIMLAMTIALLMGCLIYMVYKKFYSGVVFSRSFAVTLVGMCVLTCMVTLAISTNIVNLPWYGRSIIDCALSYSRKRPYGSFCIFSGVLPQVSQQEQKCIPWFGEQRSL